MGRRLKVFRFLALAMIGYVVPFLILGEPKRLDSPFGAGTLIALFVLFLFWIWAMASWGAVLSRIFKIEGPSPRRPLTDLWMDAMLGSIFAAWLMGLPVFFPALMGPSLKPLAPVFALIGIAWGAKDLRPKLARDREWSKKVLVLLGVGVFLKIWEATALQTNGDPLMYHLLGPRLWFDHGSLAEWFHDPTQFITGQFEGLYLWADLFLAGRPGEGLLTAQIFSQWTSAFFGYGMTWLGLMVLAETTFKRMHARSPVDDFLILGASLGALSSGSLLWTSALAKNDLGLIAWSIFAFWLLLVERSHSKSGNALVAFFILGGVAISKPNLAIFALAIGVFYLIRTRKILIPVMGSLLGLLVIALRNFIATGNPIFPWLTHRLGGENLLGPTFKRALETPFHASDSHDFFHFISDIRFLIQDHPFSILFWGFPIVILLNRKRFLNSTPGLEWIIPIFMAAFGFLFIFLEHTEPRYFGPTILIGTLLGASFWFQYRRINHRVGVLVLLVALSVSQIPVHEIGKLLQHRSFLNYDSQGWMRSMPNGELLLYAARSIPVGQTVVHLGENHAYYLSHLTVRSPFTDPELDAKLTRAKTTHEILAAVKTISPWLIVNQTYLGDRATPMIALLNQDPQIPSHRTHFSDSFHWVGKF